MWFSYTFNYLGKHKANEVLPFAYSHLVVLFLSEYLLYEYNVLKLAIVILQVVNVITQH